MIGILKVYQFANIERIDRVGPLQQLGQGARNRFVVRPDALEEHSPFVLLVEDYIDPSAGFHPHPHRGLETVMIILDGQMLHSDHLGFKGVVGPGDAQWMTAGRGIVHDGGPHDGQLVHALQLWVGLPAQLRNSNPGTREQRLGQAMMRPAQNGSVTIYGAGSLQPGEPEWSRWPLTISDVRLGADGRCLLEIAPGERMFAYVLKGSFEHPESGRSMVAGDVVWIELTQESRQFEVTTASGGRLMVYSGQPILEPVVARGPFVMGSEEEIAQAYDELRTNRFLETSA
ncbi:pirin family protein [Sphingomonas sp. PAMC 26617]|uniref:pirin family protein n=1 Tax=Sphingomonas sp. PAMC 26617 TaxID=1112216 RepID=UPI0009D9E1C6|nr:pirin family protein [Sphingomonas sp. PAMC 26617]